MRPYLLVSGDFTKTGGMDRANHALALYLAQSGRAVHLVTHRADEDLARMVNVTVHLVGKPLGSYYLGRRKIDRAGRKWAKVIVEKGGRVIVNGGNCNWADVNWVHYVHAAHHPQMSGGLLRRLVGLWKRRAFLKEERKALHNARLIVVNSNRTMRDVMDHLHIGRERIHTVYLGTDTEQFRPAGAQERAQLRKKFGWPEGTPVAVFVGALGDRRKNFDTVLEAWRILHHKMNWDAKLVVVGQGGELQYWRDQAERDGLGGKIEFLGFRKDVHEITRAADVMIAPARYEPYGLSVHEAMCCGVPAIVSACSGVSERYPNDLRELIVRDENDPEELALKLLAWQTGRQRLRGVMIGVSQQLRTRTWEQMADEMIRMIEFENDSTPMKLTA